MSRELEAVLSRELRRWRARRGLTQAQLAEAAGIATEAYGRIERGEALPRADTLVALARALDASTDALLGLGEPTREVRASEITLRYGSERTAEIRRLVYQVERLPPSTLRALRQFLGTLPRKRPR